MKADLLWTEADGERKCWSVDFQSLPRSGEYVELSIKGKYHWLEVTGVTHMITTQFIEWRIVVSCKPASLA